MSPVHDPRFSKQQRVEWTREESAIHDRDYRDYYIPAALLVIGLVMAFSIPTLLYGSENRPWLDGIYSTLLMMAFVLPCGFIGLLVSSRIFYDGAGELALAVLRLSAASAMALGVSAFFPLVYGMLVGIVVMAVMIAWLFQWSFVQGAVAAAVGFGSLLIGTIIIDAVIGELLA